MTAALDTAHPDVRITAVLSTIDVLLARQLALAEQVAHLRERLAGLAEERRLREAMALLSAEGRNAEERTARLRLQLAADGDVRRLMEAEKDARLKLAEVEAELWATRMKARACLTLLRLAAGQTEGEEGEVGQAEAEGEAP
jgi:hypothetical protein